MLKVISWNTQGAKWDSVWNDRIVPLLDQHDILVLVCESGWPPWIQDHNVIQAVPYPYNSQQKWFQKPDASAFATAFGALQENNRNAHAYWVPWVQSFQEINASASTNSRCSMGVIWIPQRRVRTLTLSISVTGAKPDYPAKRPYVRCAIQAAGQTLLTVVFAHLISGWPSEATRDVKFIADAMRDSVPQSTSIMLVGDLNINLLLNQQRGRFDTVLANNGLKLYNTGQPTQQSGGELDACVFYDANNQYQNVAVNWGPQWKQPGNASDHAVISYDVNIPA